MAQGEIFRLKKWRTYAKRVRGQPGVNWMELSAHKGKHAIVAHLGSLVEGEALTREWIVAQMKLMGWIEDPVYAESEPDQPIQG